MNLISIASALAYALSLAQNVQQLQEQKQAIQMNEVPRSAPKISVCSDFNALDKKQVAKNRALFEAVQNNDEGDVKCLMQVGADYNAEDPEWDNTAMDFAKATNPGLANMMEVHEFKLFEALAYDAKISDQSDFRPPVSDLKNMKRLFKVSIKGLTMMIPKLLRCIWKK